MLDQAHAVRTHESPVAVDIAVENVSARYDDSLVLNSVSFSVAAGERIGIVGRSGVGKSTLLGIISGLDEPESGRVQVGDTSDPAGRLAHCVVMPQADCLLPWRNALENAVLALENQGLSRRAARAEADALFVHLGLDGAQERTPNQLSGGMRQRVAFARTVLARKPVLLLDEPFGALDTITRYELQDWLRGYLLEAPSTVVLVTHDIEEALVLCDRVLVFSVAGSLTEIAGFGSTATPRSDLISDSAFLARRRTVLEEL